MKTSMNAMNPITPTDASTDRLAYNSEDARRALGGISRTTLWKLEKLGKIRPVECVRHKLYPRSELIRFLSANLAGRN
jgi:hypothetical protein